MRKSIGILLWCAGHVINVMTLFSAIIYLFGTVIWMHAPLFGVLALGAPMAILPLGLAWLCVRTGRSLRDGVPLFPVSPTKRWLMAGIGIVAVGALAMTFHTGRRDYACHVERSREAAARQLEAEKSGFERVCEDDLARWDVAFTAIGSATRRLAFTPVDLGRTPFAGYEALGGRAEDVGDVRSRLYRGFRTPDGHRVTLFEQDMSADGSTSWRDPKDEPERINGLPARLVVMEAPSGKAVSLLSWKDGRRDFQLWVDANIARVPWRAQLFALAASLPHAAPACPNEPPPRQYDAQGVPIGEPMPALVTIGPEGAILNKNKRPCK